MALPILEKIALEIVSRLEAIDAGSGYELTVDTVDRLNRIEPNWTPKNNVIAVVQGDEESNDELSYPRLPSAVVAFDVVFALHYFVRESDKSTTRSAATENQAIAAMRKALAAPGLNWQQFSGNAINAKFLTGNPFAEDEGSHDGMTCGLLVQYRHPENDPYTVAA